VVTSEALIQILAIKVQFYAKKNEFNISNCMPDNNSDGNNTAATITTTTIITVALWLGL